MRAWMTVIWAICLILMPVGAADVPSAWAQQAVQTARTAGLVPEKVDSAYHQPITRAEFCALAASVYRAWERDGLVGEGERQTVQFSDCEDTDVLLCASLGVVKGVGADRFAPDSPMQRQEAACMLHRLGALRADYDDSPEARLPYVFADGADIRSWARNDINWVYRQRVMNGTGENTFHPEGAYTREQSIVTMLRLYDAQYAAAPLQTQTDTYQVVIDNAGAGVSIMHLEDADGNQLLTDFQDTEGYFYNIQLFGDWVGLIWNNHSSLAVYQLKAAVYQLKTGETLQEYWMNDMDEECGIGWAHPIDQMQQAVILRADGTHSTALYTPVTPWRHGRAIVKEGETVLKAIDAQGNTLWHINYAVDMLDGKSVGLGDRLLVQQNDQQVLLYNGTITPLNTSADNLYGTTFCKWSDTFISGKNGWYTLYDLGGKALTETYANALDEVGQDIYARWVDDSHYTYFRCPVGGKLETLFTLQTMNGRPGSLATDGAGVYALRTGEAEVTCFDRFGQTLGVIQSPFVIDNTVSVTFENGCVRIYRTATSTDKPMQQAWFLPTGEAIQMRRQAHE